MLKVTLKSLLSFDYLNIKQLVKLALDCSFSVRAKIGWLLDLKSGKWKVPYEAIAQLKSNLGEGPYYFNYKDKAEAIYINRWKLYVPYSDDEVLQWII